MIYNYKKILKFENFLFSWIPKLLRKRESYHLTNI